MREKNRFAVWFPLLALAVAAMPLASQPPSQRRESRRDTVTADLPLRLYLSPIRVDSGYRLTPNGYGGATHVEQNIERGDSARVASVIGVPTRKIDTWNGVQFVSPALAGPFELSGVFSGRLEVIANKESFDFEISLYELTASANYVLISSYSSRSDGDDRSHRMALQPGIRQFVDYKSAAFASRPIQNGSRLVVLITLLSPGTMMNGAAVAGVTADTTSVPLKIGWYGDSYIDLRVRHL